MTGVLCVFIVFLLTIVAGQGAAIGTWIRRAESQRRRAETAEKVCVDQLMGRVSLTRDERLWEKQLAGGDE